MSATGIDLIACILVKHPRHRQVCESCIDSCFNLLTRQPGCTTTGSPTEAQAQYSYRQSAYWNLNTHCSQTAQPTSEAFCEVSAIPCFTYPSLVVLEFTCCFGGCLLWFSRGRCRLRPVALQRRSMAGARCMMRCSCRLPLRQVTGMSSGLRSCQAGSQWRLRGRLSVDCCLRDCCF